LSGLSGDHIIGRAAFMRIARQDQVIFRVMKFSGAVQVPGTWRLAQRHIS
jgi:hypothetical protein